MTPDSQIEPRVRAIVAEVIRKDTSATGRDDDLVESLGVDSLQGLRILAAVEKRCAVRLPDDELVHMRTIGRIVDAVEQLQHGGRS